MMKSQKALKRWRKNTVEQAETRLFLNLNFRPANLNADGTAGWSTTTMPRVPIMAFTIYEALAKSLTSKLAINTGVSKPDDLDKLVQCIQSVLGPVS
jgi:hypothetical protein